MRSDVVDFVKKYLSSIGMYITVRYLCSVFRGFVVIFVFIHHQIFAFFVIESEQEMALKICFTTMRMCSISALIDMMAASFIPEQVQRCFGEI